MGFVACRILSRVLALQNVIQRACCGFVDARNKVRGAVSAVSGCYFPRSTVQYKYALVGFRLVLQQRAEVLMDGVTWKIDFNRGM